MIMPESKEQSTNRATISAEAIASGVATNVARSVGKRIPILGTSIYIDDIKNHLKEGDFSGAAIRGVGMLCSEFPAFGTAAGIAIDVYLSQREINKENGWKEDHPKAKEEDIPDSYLAKYYNKKQAEKMEQSGETMIHEEKLVVPKSEIEKMKIAANKEVEKRLYEKINGKGTFPEEGIGSDIKEKAENMFSNIIQKHLVPEGEGENRDKKEEGIFSTLIEKGVEKISKEVAKKL